MALKAEKESWDIAISAKNKLLDLHLREIIKYRDLVFLFIRRDFILQFKQTVLGPIWLIVQPLISTVAYTFVFGKLANLSTDGVPHTLFYYGGTMMWDYFTGVFWQNSGVFHGNAGVFGKVYFPRLVPCISMTVGCTIKLFIQFIPFLFFYIRCIASGNKAVHPSLCILAFPLLIIWIAALGFGLGIILSSLTTKYRDLNRLMHFVMRLALYATPVVYPLSEAPAKWLWAFYINPMTAPIEMFRVWFYGVGHVPWEMVLISFAFVAVALFVGLVLFTKNERTFVDVI